MIQVLEFGDFLRGIYLRKRFGHLSPLTLLRVEVTEWKVECDWLMPSLCTWDADLSPAERTRNASRQALEDALSVRKLLFHTMPRIECAAMRVYRSLSNNRFELVITGTVHRRERVCGTIHSLAMRAKLLGLQFQMGEGALEGLDEGHGGSISKYVEIPKSQSVEVS